MVELTCISEQHAFNAIVVCACVRGSNAVSKNMEDENSARRIKRSGEGHQCDVFMEKKEGWRFYFIGQRLDSFVREH